MSFWTHQLRAVIGPCFIIDVINHGLGVFGPEMAMDFGSIDAR